MFSMMNKNVHLTSLFYVRQNCETALLSIWNVLINFLVHFWKLKDLKTLKMSSDFRNIHFFSKDFLMASISENFFREICFSISTRENFFRGETRKLETFWALDSRIFLPLKFLVAKISSLKVFKIDYVVRLECNFVISFFLHF